MARTATPHAHRDDAMLKLFVAGESPRSVRARDNLERIMAELAMEDLPVRVVDVLAEPTETLGNAVFATPSLILTVDGQRHTLVGDLSETATLRDLLTRIGQ